MKPSEYSTGPMSLSAKQLALVRVAKAQLGLTDETYRDVLMNVAGVSSSTELNNQSLDILMRHFGLMGFKLARKIHQFGPRPGMASPAQVALIRQLWATYTDGQGTDKTLGVWLEHKFKVTALRFLPAEAAPKAITALRAMNGRKGPITAY